MRKQNALFFAAGLLFGVLVGYFLFQSVSQSPAGVSTAPRTAAAPGDVSSPRVVDPEQVAALERLAEQSPEDGEVRNQIGTLYLEAGQYDQAVRWLREAVTRKSDDLHVRNHLALALAGLGRVDEALSEYEAALARDPSHPQSLLGLGRLLLYGKNDIRRGLEAWEKLLQVAPGSAEAESIREELEALKSAHSGS